MAAISRTDRRSRMGSSTIATWGTGEEDPPRGKLLFPTAPPLSTLHTDEERSDGDCFYSTEKEKA